MSMYIFEDAKSGEIRSIDAINESKARVDLGEKWHLARLVPHADAQAPFDEAVVESGAANLNNAPNGEQLKTRRETLARIVARLPT